MTNAMKVHVMDWWEGIRKRFVSKNVVEGETVLEVVSTAYPLDRMIADCLQHLHACSAGSAMYILDCLCPDDSSLVIDLLHLELDIPHEHRRFSEIELLRTSESCERVLLLLRTRTKTIPQEQYSQFWLELTKCWLLTCPIDPEHYLADDTGKELYCYKLRSELIERILNIS